MFTLKRKLDVNVFKLPVGNSPTERACLRGCVTAYVLIRVWLAPRENVTSYVIWMGSGGKWKITHKTIVTFSYGQPVVIFYTFLGWKLQPELPLLPHQHCGIRFLPMLNSKDIIIVSFRRCLKSHFFIATYRLCFLAHSCIRRRLAHCFRLRDCLIVLHCRATDLDLRG